MTQGVIQLGPLQLGLATLLVVAAGSISLALKLGVERRLAVAALRTVVQLGLLGLVLERVFALRRPELVVLLLVVMTLFAAREAVARSGRGYRGIRLDAWLVIAGSSLAVGGVVTQAVVGVDPWYDPQYVIPIVGMILGNSLNGISLCLDRFLEHVTSRRSEIELYLAFGASRRDCTLDRKTASIPGQDERDHGGSNHPK